MKIFRFALCAIALILFTCGCQDFIPEPAEVQPVSATPNPLLPVPGEKSMKGYELYSWQEVGQWYFSVLLGTNREKTLEEIQAPGAALKGLDALQAILKKTPAGQIIIWSARGELAFPPAEMISQVEQICKEQGLELGIVR